MFSKFAKSTKKTRNLMKIKRTLVYIAPQLTIIELKQGAFILAGSPPVRPGGDGKEPNKGNVNVVGSSEDDEDTNPFEV